MHTKIFPRYESFENWTNSFLLVPNFVCTPLRNFNANFFYSLRPNLDATHFLILNDSVCKALKHERKGVSRRRVYKNLAWGLGGWRIFTSPWLCLGGGTLKEILCKQYSRGDFRSQRAWNWRGFSFLPGMIKWFLPSFHLWTGDVRYFSL